MRRTVTLGAVEKTGLTGVPDVRSVVLSYGGARCAFHFWGGAYRKRIDAFVAACTGPHQSGAAAIVAIHAAARAHRADVGRAHDLFAALAAVDL